MTTIIFTFFLAFLASFFLTPLVIKVANRYGLVDEPSARKVHQRPIPRLGGVAIFLSLFVPLSLLFFNDYMFSKLVTRHSQLPVFLLGAVLIFALGLWDDLRRLPASVKFGGQILVGIIVYLGGIEIHIVSVPFIDNLQLGFLSLPVTVFWIVLVINAINLIDGLDGLAAGIGIFVCLTMLFISLTHDRTLVAIGFASLAGSLLGFLRYNFNPATIFMGDSGSYFIGYMIATLSMMGSVKGQVATAMLIPIIALGVPLIDTLWAPVRRFVLGRKMFDPDSGHLHHSLMKLGYTHRRAVLTLYGGTILLGFVSVVLVHANDEIAALILLVIGTGVIFLARFAGLKEFVNPSKLSSWLHEVSDVSGITKERRSFLNHQLIITNSQTIEELWVSVCAGLQALELDMAELVIYRSDCTTKSEGTHHDSQQPGSCQVDTAHTWKRFDHINSAWLDREGLFRLELPLLDEDQPANRLYGTLILIKDIQQHGAGYYMLTRIEHLRRSINSTLKKIQSQS